MISVWGALMVPAFLAAQSWGGTLHGGARDGAPATMELAIAAGGVMSGKISGPTIQTGIVTGIHNAKTGEVKFNVTVEGQPNPFPFTGAIVKDTLKASTTNANGQVYSMRLVKGAKAPEVRTTSSGPQNPSDPALAAAQRGFTEVSGWVARSAAMVPAEKYSYRPVGTVRTFGELVGHVADAYTYYCARASGKQVEWSDAIEKGTKDKTALAAKLKTAQDACTAAYAKGQIGPLMENVGHTNLHYGNMITYLRMLGMTPPSS